MSEPETDDTERCIGCGNEIDGEPVWAQGGVKDDAGQKLSGGESVPIDEVIEFDDGPYCSLDCSIDTETVQEDDSI